MLCEHYYAGYGTITGYGGWQPKYIAAHIIYFAVSLASSIVLHSKIIREWAILIPLSQLIHFKRRGDIIFLLGEAVTVNQRALCHYSIVKKRISRVGRSSTVAGRGNEG